MILLAKSEIVEQKFLFEAGDFSPPNAYIFGTKVPCPDRYAPRQFDNSRFVEERLIMPARTSGIHSASGYLADAPY